MSAMRSTLHRLRGFVASLEDGMGVNGVVQQPWIDEAYRLVDAALAELEALEERQAALEAVAEAARDYLSSPMYGSDSEAQMVAALARLAAVQDGPLDTSYRERRVERRMADPEYRQAYQQAVQDGQTDG